MSARRLDSLLRSGPAVWVASLVAIVSIGFVDFLSGAELRVFPLYYLPISLVAWRRSQSEALSVTALCTATWVLSNGLGGMQFSYAVIWAANTAVQGISFAVVGVLIVKLKSALARERGLSRTDALTGLPNSRAFYTEAARLVALCRRRQRPVTVAYIDLDNFKFVNDNFGHQAGDALLQNIAGRLRGSIRPSDMAARIGGDEFVVLLPELGPDDAAASLERVRRALAEAALASRGSVTVSIGGVTFLTPSDDIGKMVREADSRMYDVKTTGKDRVSLAVSGAGPTPA